MILERQGERELPPRLAEMAERMKKPPANVHKGLLIAFLLPGMNIDVS